jgi:DNA-binding XRE family transcriptional regulator
MAETNPTGDGRPVALKIPPDHLPFLGKTFGMALGGIRDELTEYPDELREPARLHREEAAYERLVEALDAGEIVPDRDLFEVLADLAETIDGANEYGRVVAEHAALLGVRDQVGLRRGAVLTFAANLLEAREEANLSQEELGSRASLDPAQIDILERGRRLPKIGTLLELAGALGLSRDRLLERIGWRQGGTQGGCESTPRMATAGGGADDAR